jgi:hypothetical protein
MTNFIPLKFQLQSHKMGRNGRGATTTQRGTRSTKERGAATKIVIPFCVAEFF